MLFAKFFAELDMFAWDHEEESYCDSKLIYLEADTVWAMAKKINDAACDENYRGIRDTCIWCTDSLDKDGERFFLDDKIISDKDGELAFDTLCEAIASTMKLDYKFREFTIRYK